MHSIGRENNFDLIRIFAASQVMVTHGYLYWEIGSNAIAETLFRVLSWFPGVPIFFFISGFLISASLSRNTSLTRYFVNRLLRIFPGLWLCLLISILSVYVAGYSGFFSVDLSDMTIWLTAQITIGQFYNPDFLRGYATGVLNGSLWTIPVELQFYVLLPILFFWVTKVRSFAPIWLFAITSFFIAWYMMYQNQWSDFLLYKLIMVTIVPYFYMFFIGILCQKYFELVYKWVHGKAILWGIAFGLSSVCIEYFGGQVGSNHPNPISLLILCGLVLSCAYSMPTLSHNILKGNDLSYGIYIYHMVVVNFLLHFNIIGVTGMWTYYFLVFVLAALSWKLIEKPALNQKNKLYHWFSNSFTNSSASLNKR